MRLLLLFACFCLPVTSWAADPKACVDGSFNDPGAGAAACWEVLDSLNPKDEAYLPVVLKAVDYEVEATSPKGILRQLQGMRLPGTGDDTHLALQAELLMKHGRLDAARKAAEASVGLNPVLTNAWNVLGLLDMRAGDNEQALKMFFKSLQADPDDVQTLKNRTLVFVRMGRLTRAVGDVNRALNIAADDPQLYLLRAQILLRRNNDESDDLARAQDDLGSVLRYLPDNHGIHNLRAVVMLRRGHTGDAMRHLMTAVELQPDNAVYHSNLATVFIEFARKGRRMPDKIGDPALAALKHAEIAVEGKPDGSRFNILGIARGLLDDPEGAYVAFDRAAAESPKHARLYHGNLALTDHYAGDVEADWSDASRTALRACLSASCDPTVKP